MSDYAASKRNVLRSIAAMVLLSVALSPVLGATPASAATTPVLVAHWKLDETTAGVPATDSIGSNDGTPGTQSAVYPTPSTTVPTVSFTNARSMSFDGDNYFTINNPISTDFTICAWIKTASSGGGTNHWESAPIMDAEVGGVAYDMGFGVGNGGKLMFGNGGDDSNGNLYDAQVNGSTTIDDNVWHNVCATRDNTTGDVNLYVDAQQDGTGTTGVGALTDNSAARIGWGYDGAALYQGLIDDVRVYNGVLTTTELEALAQGLDNPFTPTVSITSPATSSVSNAWSPVVNWGTSNACAYSWDNATWATVNCAQNGADVPAPSNGAGLHLYVRGNLTGSTNYGTANATFTYDSVAPVVEAGANKLASSAFALSSAAASDATSGIASVAWSKVSGPGTVTFSNANTVAPNVTAVGQDGTYVLRLTATDSAGNVSFDDTTVVWDTTKPVITWNSGGFPDANTDNTSATFAFTASDLLSGSPSYQCKLDTGAFVSCTSPSTLDRLAQGSHTFTVRATDHAGNTDDLAYSWTVVADQGNDANGDGIVDAVQENVASFSSDVTNKTVALSVDSACDVQKAAIAAESKNAVPDSGFDYPEGMFDFTVNCGANGFTTTVTQYYYDITSSQLSLRKYNPNTRQYSPVNQSTITTTNVYGRMVTTVSYQIADGGSLDADGTENGVIVDPAGLATPVTTTPVAAIPGVSGVATLAATGGSYVGLLCFGSAFCLVGFILHPPRRRSSNTARK